MIDDETISKLSGIELFRGLGTDDIKNLLAHAATLSFAEGQPVFEAGGEERALYFLMDGSVEIELEVPFVEQKVLDTLSPVSVFGESSFFHPHPHSVTVRAMAESTVIRLEREAYDSLLDTNNLAACRMGANAAEIIAAKLQHTDSWIADSLETEKIHKVQERWWDFRQTMGHAFQRPGGGFSTGAGWR